MWKSAYAASERRMLMTTATRLRWRINAATGNYYRDKELDRTKVENEVKALLAKAKKGESWTDPQGVHHTEILVNDEIVGNLWEKRDDLHKLEIGGYWTARSGVKAELVHAGKVVGMVLINE
jgi:hypothetical protein